MDLERKKIIPHLKQKSKLDFFEVQGSVYSVDDFARKFSSLLQPNEQSIITNQIGKLKKNVVEFFEKPLANVDKRNNLIISSKKIIFKKIGGRSALWEKKNLKFKGCRPIQKGLYFPHEKLDFGDEKMTMTKIPFGVLTAENVMREILAYSFFAKLGIGVVHQPVAVFEYSNDGDIIGYCLVSYSKTETRLESQEEFYGMTIKDLILISQLENRFSLNILQNLQSFRGISNEWYAEEKSELMIKMNLNGGFRGVLNSNVGNDIKYKNKFFICDFDTFTAIEIPKNPDYKFIKSFLLWCVIEILKSSPLVFAYVDMDGLNKKEAAKKIWKIYAERSLLWQRYYQKFISKATKMGWDINLIKQAIQEAVETKVFYDTIQDSVVYSEVLKNTYQPEMSFYTRQG
jgi:hypothetical protein